MARIGRGFPNLPRILRARATTVLPAAERPTARPLRTARTASPLASNEFTQVRNLHGVKIGPARKASYSSRAWPITALKTPPLPSVSETDVARAFHASKSARIGGAQESARAPQLRSGWTLIQKRETDVSRRIRAVKIGQLARAVEDQQAGALTHGTGVGFARAVELTQVRSLSPHKAGRLMTATESVVSQRIVRRMPALRVGQPHRSWFTELLDRRGLRATVGGRR
ncbi:hypothetical protein ACIBG7_12645 [Nonomuraea sp. NPDC050328]|uniref:hypothetical protein n=1 Tax=Nonomuraea sp. NPDC050328 TaxID=3364361 RepID=UPI0037986235